MQNRQRSNPSSPQSPSWKATSDEDLLSQVASGDRAAFEMFYDRHSARVFGLIGRILGDRREAEDVFQDTFLEVWKRASTYDSARACASAWLIQMARSRSIDNLRRRLTRSKLGQKTESPEEQDSHNALERMDQEKLINGALARLPEKQRSAINLAFYRGFTHEQIAREQAIPLGTAKQRIRRGMMKMRDMLNGKHVDNER